MSRPKGSKNRIQPKPSLFPQYEAEVATLAVARRVLKLAEALSPDQREHLCRLITNTDRSLTASRFAYPWPALPPVSAEPHVIPVIHTGSPLPTMPEVTCGASATPLV
jgi:hypothetical protein